NFIRSFSLGTGGRPVRCVVNERSAERAIPRGRVRSPRGAQCCKAHGREGDDRWSSPRSGYRPGRCGSTGLPVQASACNFRRPVRTDSSSPVRSHARHFLPKFRVVNRPCVYTRSLSTHVPTETTKNWHSRCLAVSL